MAHILHLLYIMRTDTLVSEKIKTGLALFEKKDDNCFMRRKPANFRKSSKRFQHKAQKTHSLNTPNHRPARGGIRL